MTANLRTVFRPLLWRLGMPETELWELERVGRTAGIFSVGRTGPGGGTPATTETVVRMVVALLAGLTKRDGARLTQFYVDARVTDILPESEDEASRRRGVPRQRNPNLRCGFTGATSFGAALAAIIRDPELALEVQSVDINHSFRLARIAWDGGGKESYFGGLEQPEGYDYVRYTITTIENPFFDDLAEQLAKLDIP